MARMTKEQKAQAKRVERIAQAAVNRIPIPILKIPALYKYAEAVVAGTTDDVIAYNMIRAEAQKIAA